MWIRNGNRWRELCRFTLMISNHWWLTLHDSDALQCLSLRPPPRAPFHHAAAGLTRLCSRRRKRTAPRTTESQRLRSPWPTGQTSACLAFWTTWTRKWRVSFHPWMNSHLLKTRWTWGCPTCTLPPCELLRICVIVPSWHLTFIYFYLHSITLHFT